MCSVCLSELTVQLMISCSASNRGILTIFKPRRRVQLLVNLSEVGIGSVPLMNIGLFLLDINAPWMLDHQVIPSIHTCLYIQDKFT